MMERILRVCCCLLIAGLAGPAAAQADPPRRERIKARAVELFDAGTNDCRAFAELARFAADLAPSVEDWLDEMRLVLIGVDWRRRPGQRGPWFHGKRTGDSGFKREFLDGSSQVEHAFTAIYLGKMLPPGGAAMAGGIKEIKDAYKRATELSTADLSLWTIGAEIGENLTDSSLTQIEASILRAICAEDSP